jgi:cardiolipin synthase
MLTVASYITLVRLFLSPVVVYFIQQEQLPMAAVIFLIAATTDLVDGFVARRFGQQSDLGQILDPLADKCLIMVTLYSLLFYIQATFWSQVIIYSLLAKELVLLIVGGFLKWRYNFFIKPSRLSRAASIGEIILILFLFASLIMYQQIPATTFMILLSSNLLLSLWLLIRYTFKIIKIIRH